MMNYGERGEYEAVRIKSMDTGSSCRAKDPERIFRRIRLPIAYVRCAGEDLVLDKKHMSGVVFRRRC